MSMSTMKTQAQSLATRLSNVSRTVRGVLASNNPVVSEIDSARAEADRLLTDVNQTSAQAPAPATPGTDEYVKLASGVKRYLYCDGTHQKVWNVVEADEAGSVRRTKRRFYEVEILGTASVVTRPGTGLLNLGGCRVNHFLVTTAALKCWRKPAEERSRVQPYAPVTR